MSLNDTSKFIALILRHKPEAIPKGRVKNYAQIGLRVSGLNEVSRQ
jgi:RNA:NAD 2'-phosphotransferase (TPT1/KptA family)